MNDPLIYEQPLNERVRTLLRIEYLFNRIDHHSVSSDAWDTRLTVSLLIELNELLKRSDIKAELTKELERHQSILNALQSDPRVDKVRLKKVLGGVSEALSALRDEDFQPGALLNSDELITSIKQRNSVAGGACNFDLPGYHHWLNKPAKTTQRHLREWQEDFLSVRTGTILALNIIRSNANPSKETATGGAFQKSIETTATSQLIRIILPRDSDCFPEISGGKHRFSVRFMQQTLTADRPVQSEEDIEFELHFCVL